METFFIKFKRVFAIFFIIGIIVVVAPVIAGCGYTYLCEDDFSFEGGAKDAVEQYGSSLVGATHKMVEYYNSNQGTFLFNFLIHFVRAYSRADFPGFHLFMILATAVFCILVLYLIKIITRNNNAFLGIALAVFAALFAMHNTAEGREVFFWYTGVMNFLIELSLALAATIFCILYIRKKKLRYLVVSTVAAFFASGGALNIVTASISWLVAVAILKRDEVANDRKIIIPAVGGFIGAFINGIAPGNFKRSEEGFKEGHSTLFDGLRDTFKCLTIEDKVLFTSVVFILMLMLVFVLCLVYKVKVLEDKVSVVNLVIVIVGTWLARFFTMFPVAYGYHIDYMANMRTTSSYEIVAKLMYFLEIAVIAQFVSEKFEGKKEKISIGLSVAGILVVVIFHAGIKNELKEGMTYLIYNDYRTGALQESYAVREYVLSSFRLAEKGSDAVVYVRPFKKSVSSYGMGLGVDCEGFVNRSAAGLYDLHTTTVVYLE